MSSTLNVYAVSMSQLKQVLGSANQALIDAIFASEGDWLESINDIDDEAGFSCEDAIGFLIHGAINQECPGYLYGYGLEVICAHIGTRLPEISGISGAYDWIQEVDAVLNEHGVPISLNDLVYTGSPVPIPQPDDYPVIGKWDAHTIAPALDAMRSIDLSQLDYDAKSTLVQMQGWLEATLKTPDRCVIGFLS